MPKEKRNRIIVIGDIVLDKYVYVRPKIQSAERGHQNYPIPQYDIVHIDKKLGGAYNVAFLLQNRLLNTDVEFYTILQDDFKDLVHENIFRFENFNRSPHGKLSIKQRHVHFETLYTNGRFDYYRSMPKCTEQEVYEWVKTINFADADVVVLSDYIKGLFSAKTIQHIVAHSKVVIVDTKNPELDTYIGADFIKLNEHEFKNVQDYYGAKDYLEHIAPFKMIITMGEKKTMLIETDLEDGSVFDQRVDIRKMDPEYIVDTVGCGDAFMAGVAWSLAENGYDKPIQAINAGHEMSHISLSKMGATW